MSIKKLVSSVKRERIVSIDPSSHSLAWVVYDVTIDDVKMIDSGKIDYKKDKAISLKFSAIDAGLKKIISDYSPGKAVIEQSIYVQNFETSRIISYIIGYSWGVLSQAHCQVEDVNPLVWKNGIGYKNLSKKDTEDIKNNGASGSLQLKLKAERKKRVRDLVRDLFPESSKNIDDDDIIDAAGIGLWYAKKKLQEVKHGE